MAEKLLLGIDIGTQGTKTALFNSEGVLLSEAFEPSRLISERPGMVIQNPDDLFDSVIHTIRTTLLSRDIRAQDICGIGLSGQMSGIMGIDEAGHAVTPYDSWLDTRCEPYIEIIKSEAEDLFIRTTGSPVSYAHGPKILWWKNECPEIYKLIAKFVVPATYVALRLCDLSADKAYLDYTHLHFSGFADVQAMTWSTALLSRFGVDPGKMPTIVEPWHVIGGVTSAVASATGLVEGTPVITGCGDQAATSLGAGITKPGQILDVSGTACLMSFCTDTFAPDLKEKTFLYARSAIKGLWIPLAYAGGSGLCLKWFADELAHDVQGGLAALDEKASRVPPGSDRLIFVPHFGGRSCPNNPHVRGSYIGLNWSHQKGQMYRAIMEGIGYEYRYYVRVMDALLGEMPKGDVFVIGGGSKSAIFNQIKANILNKRYWTLSRKDGAPLGSAVLAGYGTGVLADIPDAITRMIQLRDLIEPDAMAHQQYQPFAEIYEEIISRLAPVYEKLIAK